MNIKEFNKVSESRWNLQFSHVSYGGLPWEDWYKLARMTNKINYGCYFRNDGSCERSRRLKKEGHSQSKMRCCHNCADNIGYLHFIQDDPKVIKRIASSFRRKIGFWREGKGCVLPRKYRSTVCLGYRCNESNESSISGNGNILIAFMNAIRLKSLKGRHLYTLGKALLVVSI